MRGENPTAAAVPKRAPPPENRKWRDDTRVHPAADLFPMMGDAELDELAADIAKNGVRQPIVWHGNQLLDGRNRVAAVHRIPDEKRRAEIVAEWQNGKNCVIYGMLPDPIGYVISANIHRRHLTAEQKRGLIEKLLKAQPEKSDRQIAATVKASPTTIGTVRAALEETGDVSKLDTRTDAVGRQQPARKLGEHSRKIGQDELARFRADAPSESDSPATIHEIGDRKDAIRIIDEAVRLVAQRGSEVKAIPIGIRVARARSLIDALGLDLEDLVPSGRR
jgi:hypothetical protein